jgi:hypothetical protein
MIKIEYEILYKVPFSDPVEFQSHVSGRPDIRTRICKSEGALHKLNTSPHLYQYDVLKVWEISDEEYEHYMEGQRYQYEAIKRNHDHGVE